MSLALVMGRAGSGKSDFLLADMKGRPDAVYIVPEQFSFTAEKKLIEAQGYSGLGGAQVLSFRRLAFRVEEETGRGGRARLDAAGRIMAISAVTAALADELSLFGGAARRGELNKTAQSLIAMFKQYNIPPEALLKAAQKLKNPLLALKLKDAGKIYLQYEDFLREGFFDSDDDLTLLAKNIRKTGLFKGRRVYIDQFVSFTPQEYGVISALAAEAENVTVALTLGEEDDFLCAKKTARRLLALADEGRVHVLPAARIEGAMQGAPPELAHLEREFFAPAPRAFDGEITSLRVFRAKNQNTEIEEVARQICALVRERGYQYRDIAIIARDLDQYEKHLSGVFPRYGIPLFLDKKVPLASHAVALFALSALEIITKNWSVDSVFSYMKTSFSGLDEEESDILENFCLAAGVRPFDWTSDSRWDMRKAVYLRGAEASEEDLAELETVNRAREKLLAPLRRLERKIRRGGKANDLCRAFYDFLTECGVDKKAEETALFLENEGESDLAARSRQVYGLLISALDSLALCFGEKELDAKLFCEALSAGLGEVEIGIIPSTLDSLFAGGIDRIKGHGAKAVFIVGANDGVFPAAAEEDSVFSDAERAALMEYGIEMPPDSREQSYAEQLLTYNALTCAKRELFVSFCAASTSGEALRPSIIITKLAELFPALKTVDEETGLDGVDYISNAAATFAPLALALGKKEGGVWREALGFYSENPDYAEKIRLLKEHLAYRNRARQIDKELMERFLGGEIYASVSRLESYRRCPFSYFARYVLNLGERETMDFGSADLGSFLHDFIDDLSRRIAALKGGWREADGQTFDALTDETFAAMTGRINKSALKNSPRLAFSLSNLRRTAAYSAKLIREHIIRGDFEPLGYEIVFGRDGSFRPLTLTLPGGEKVHLSGRVDRADLLDCEKGKFLRVVDYKSGNRDFNLAEVYNGLNLQLCVYLTALCEQGGFDRAGALYFRLDSPIVAAPPDMGEDECEQKRRGALKMKGLLLEDGDILRKMDKTVSGKSDFLPIEFDKNGGAASSSAATAEQFKRLSEHVKKTAKQIAGGIARGDFGIFPVRGGCDYCPFGAFCAFDVKIGGCRYHVLPDFKADEVWEMLEKEAEQNGD